ncbi:hypothetical protein ACVFI8_10875 [Agarivorans sp. MS3-6]|uniref:hypothetical protein n=1 Tax=Agarivorans sp. TSD2052 TaxID=2937286 RepID=UPI00200DB836|nr:hypothetical protein [Agarivorans sp. TSD2052]UPW18677.1 hypothetical protein M0C34_21085 [Agarivorans sp. TSD2052]
MAQRKRHNVMRYWLRQAIQSPVNHLVISTLLFGALTFIIFWFTIKWNLLPLELSASQLSQENTGLFDALGGWALGFAGALVAIRIAGLAASIQQNDSIREQVNLWGSEVERISELNSRLTRAAYDAKRACAAVLLHAEELYRTQELPSRIPEHLNNPINKAAAVQNEPSEGKRELEQSLQHKLEQKLEVLVEVIEEAFKDSLFRSVLLHANSEGSSSTVNNNSTLISDFFSDRSAREQTISIIKENQHFFNILEGLHHGARNFGIGLMELRAKDLFVHFRKDLMRITEFQKQKSNNDTSKIEISDAAWLFLGLLLLRSKGDANLHSQNHGFIFLSLLLGSLPTDETVSRYLNDKASDVAKIYSKDGMDDLKREISELSKRLYFVKGEELSELAKLVSFCDSHLEYLEVFAKSTGISSTSHEDEASSFIKQDKADIADDKEKSDEGSGSRQKG